MESIIHTAAEHNVAAFFSLINNPFKLKLYFLKDLPAAYFSGLKVVAATNVSCTVSIPFKWFTKNPFRSTYFACLSMAAELSTGILAMANVYKRMPPVSLLVTGIEGKFYKKVTGLCLFTCEDGEMVKNTVTAAISSGQPQTIKAYTIGKNESGEKVAEFWITWSFKSK